MIYLLHPKPPGGQLSWHHWAHKKHLYHYRVVQKNWSMPKAFRRHLFSALEIWWKLTKRLTLQQFKASEKSQAEPSSNSKQRLQQPLEQNTDSQKHILSLQQMIIPCLPNAHLGLLLHHTLSLWERKLLQRQNISQQHSTYMVLIRCQLCMYD